MTVFTLQNGKIKKFKVLYQQHKVSPRLKLFETLGHHQRLRIENALLYQMRHRPKLFLVLLITWAKKYSLFLNIVKVEY